MSKNLKIQLLTVLSLLIVIIGCFRVVKTYKVNRDEGQFEALLVALLAASNTFLILTLNKQHKLSEQIESQKQDKIINQNEEANVSPNQSATDDEISAKSSLPQDTATH